MEIVSTVCGSATMQRTLLHPNRSDMRKSTVIKSVTLCCIHPCHLTCRVLPRDKGLSAKRLNSRYPAGNTDQATLQVWGKKEKKGSLHVCLCVVRTKEFNLENCKCTLISLENRSILWPWGLTSHQLVAAVVHGGSNWHLTTVFRSWWTIVTNGSTNKWHYHIDCIEIKIMTS